ncbi:MAG TPA: protein kinase [Vicinamibacterales bacterium]
MTSLAIGARIGAYEIRGSLGAGGMGEVYRAHDSRLGRDVALKVLPAAFLDSEERRARFEREARVLASLNHPHVGAIYGVEQSGPVTALVLELVEGETLAERVAHGRGLPVAQTLAIARQIAEALEAAHDKGIVHRDLKPANIKITADDHVKVLDFGLAKLEPTAESDPAVSPTMTAVAATREGTLLGTAAYMSPEQVRGRSVDKRADIWPFGCVIYEMLTGQRAFPGETVSDTIAAVLDRHPDWTRVPERTPARLVSLVRRCLEKDPRRRLHDIADARIELEEIASDPGESRDLTSRPTERSSPRSSVRERLAWGVAALSLVAIGATLIYQRTKPESGVVRSQRYHVSISLPAGMRFSGNPPGRFELSPDGRRIAFIAIDANNRPMLWVRALDTNAPQSIAGTDGASFPFWSFDSRSVGYVADGQLKMVDAAGGTPITIGGGAIAPLGSLFGATSAWNRDDVILFTPAGGSPLMRVTASVGRVTPATKLDTDAGEAQHWYPFFLPDGRHFLYFAVGTRTGGFTDPRGVFIGSLDAKEPAKLLLDRGSNAKYAQGRLFFLRGSALMSQPFDVDRLELTGTPSTIAENIQLSGNSTTGAAGAFSVSQTGVLAYQAGSAQIRSQLTWFDRSGKRGTTIGDPADVADVSLSPDGGRLATSLLDDQRQTRNIWLYDLSRGVGTPFTTDPDEEFAPAWSPDGTRIIFSARRQGSIDFYEKPSSGTGDEHLLFADSLAKFQASWSPDGVLAYVAGGGAIGRSDLFTLPLKGERKATPFLDTTMIETQVQFSPDGKWVAYTTRDSGRFEIYVTPFPSKDHRIRVSTAGGSWARWRRDGRELFYVAADGMLTVAAITNQRSDLQVGAVQPLFNLRARPQARLDSFPYDVSADGQHILVNTLVEDATTSGSIALVIDTNARSAK